MLVTAIDDLLMWWPTGRPRSCNAQVSAAILVDTSVGPAFEGRRVASRDWLVVKTISQRCLATRATCDPLIGFDSQRAGWGQGETSCQSTNLSMLIDRWRSALLRSRALMVCNISRRPTCAVSDHPSLRAQQINFLLPKLMKLYAPSLHVPASDRLWYGRLVEDLCAK